MMLPFTSGLVQVGKFDAECAILADRHYSRQKIGSPQFAPPGETLVLRNAEGSVLFVWNRQLQERADHQQGINCTIFRNESPRRSSEIISEAERFALARWGRTRAFTYVDRRAVQSPNPGWCFIAAGWKRIGASASGKLLLEKSLE